MQLREILKAPVITEKSILETAKDNYTFKVSLKANKKQIKEAVEKLFKVSVVKIRTIKNKGKVKRVGKRKSKVITTPLSKKAIVTLKKGDKIDLFEIKE